MFEIIFQTLEEAEKIHQLYQMEFSSNRVHYHILQDIDFYKFKIELKSSELEDFRKIKGIFSQFITECKREEWIRDILSNQFYFEDLEEQQQIVEIVHSILEGEREELSIFIDEIGMKECLDLAIEQIFEKDRSFSFDSFVKFRLRPFLQYLERYIEVSIDEYKMEQEYQMFIQALRDFLVNRSPKLKHLHLLIDNGITFFDERFFEMKRPELMRMIDRKLLINHPIYVDSASIAPLLSIAPLTIFLYTEDLEQPLVRTIQNIFEERVQMKSLLCFYESKKMFSYTVDEKI